MPGKLTYNEQKELLTILQIIYGNNPVLQQNKHRFNEYTLELTEEVLHKIQRCNNQVSDLIARLMGAGTLIAKGWLREILKEMADAFVDKKNIFDLVACRNATALGYKSNILSSFY